MVPTSATLTYIYYQMSQEILFLLHRICSLLNKDSKLAHCLFQNHALVLNYINCPHKVYLSTMKSMRAIQVRISKDCLFRACCSKTVTQLRLKDRQRSVKAKQRTKEKASEIP